MSAFTLTHWAVLEKSVTPRQNATRVWSHTRTRMHTNTHTRIHADVHTHARLQHSCKKVQRHKTVQYFYPNYS